MEEETADTSRIEVVLALNDSTKVVSLIKAVTSQQHLTDSPLGTGYRSLLPRRQSFDRLMSEGARAANRKAAVAEPADEASVNPTASEPGEGSDASEVGGGGDGDQSRSKQTVITHNERWEDAFARLKAFQRRHGHCEVPFRYAPDTRLGRWGKFRDSPPRVRSLAPRFSRLHPNVAL